VDSKLLVRRVSLAANHVIKETAAVEANSFEQLNLFTDYAAQLEEQKEEKLRLEREKSLQKAMLDIKKRYGKNAVLKGMNLQEGATAKDRNAQIGGHRA
jgi:DNA polymerase V